MRCKGSVFYRISKTFRHFFMNKNLYYLFVNRLPIERLIGRILQYTCYREN
ncbi:hypothetical protein HMPREF1981_02279 [Bacteroides pyogenes F0041]|uniref:Uncharacterized protein n=3 Tax=Bacteroides pyogenes TaxID=310300 RepID=U2CKM4_9BACE|nr:hypothetical protein HMPREF1981_02279 [Bacteroides pyogenes F0041]GAE16676.1 hypothetical protein JCM6292_3148 [Bacteroides pyogenes JCM 6292]GAE20004.1 hypothetical protein JCM6294_3134 [Bacteroides pyogenes DSM 20611 = JCM 6294]